VLADQKLIVAGTLREVAAHPHPFIQSYFKGERGRRAIEGALEHDAISPVACDERTAAEEA
jgi:phospholipid/cholesterol/gamma-HCH transport system ATP-binding protein